MSNIREVARLAGVSVATVSRALSHPEKVAPATLEKVQAAIAELDYRPNMLARNFRQARAFAIVVLVPDLSNSFFATVIRAIEDRAQQRGYVVLLGDTRDSRVRERSCLRLVETRLADGVIQLSPHATAHPDRDEILCVYACGCENTPAPSVRIDNVRAARTVVEHLLALGHRRIGVISGLRDNPHSRDRLKGYKQALRAAGLAFEPSWVAEGDFTLASGLEAARRLLARREARPTALFCMNDEMAIGALRAAKTLGLEVPKQLSVTGFDDIRYAPYTDPPLTTVAQPAEAMGRAAADLLLDRIEQRAGDNELVVLPFEFIVRGSTGPAPG
ncbi:MAG: DNA-binding transcriptional regulator CytR [Gammaproteobacteria bacterium]|nr:MAG: DNA-binding transcriptional regulator CytR [Gammaproteobacteria bacterium]